MHLDNMVKELSAAARQLGLEIRMEKGSFSGGACTVKGEKIVVLNKRHPPELHFTALAESLRELPLDRVFLTPSVRNAVEKVWKQRAGATFSPEAVQSESAPL